MSSYSASDFFTPRRRSGQRDSNFARSGILASWNRAQRMQDDIGAKSPRHPAGVGGLRKFENDVGGPNKPWSADAQSSDWPKTCSRADLRIFQE